MKLKVKVHTGSKQEKILVRGAMFGVSSSTELEGNEFEVWIKEISINNREICVLKDC